MNRLNLRPAPPRRSPATLIAGSTAVGVVLLLLIISVGVTIEHNALAARAARLTEEAEGLDRQAAVLRPVVQRADAARAQLVRLRSQAVNARALAQLETLVPPDVWVTTLALRAGTVEFSGGALRWESIHRMVGALRAAGMTPVLKSVSREDGAVRVYRYALAVGLSARGASVP